MLPAAPQSHSVPVSLTDEHWPDAIPADRPTMLVADGLFAFLTEPQIVGIFRRITDHFGSGELAFNDYGRIGWVSRLAIKLYPQKMFKDVGSQFGYPGFKDAHHPETWNPRHAAGRGGQPGRRTGSRPVSGLDPGGDEAVRHEQDGAPQGANPALRVLAQAAGSKQRFQITHQG